MGTFQDLAFYENFSISMWPKNVLLTNQPFDDETFARLEYYSEVENVGVEFFKNKGHSFPKRSFLLFQAFIRQAKTFYYGAKKLHYRASSLLYYYSFLNLVKARLVISDVGAITEKKMYHGLVYKRENNLFSHQSIYTKDGVFRLFYKSIFGIDIPLNVKLKMVNLLAYCSDVLYEYESGGFGERKIFYTLARLGIDPGKKEMWPIIAVSNFQKLSIYKKFLTPFFSYFEEVMVNFSQASRAFNIEKSDYNALSYFQSRKRYFHNKNKHEETNKSFNSLKNDVNDSLKTILQNVEYSTDGDFNLVAPLRKNFQLPFNELLAIYSIMFYLGSLVRYNPGYIEKLLNSKDAWIIERFVISTPQTFLIQMANYILEEIIIYKHR